MRGFIGGIMVGIVIGVIIAAKVPQNHLQNQKNYNKNEAIIFSSSIMVNSAPSSSSTNLFSLHSGNEIEIIDQIEGWVKIQTADGRDGWIKKTDCKSIR